MSLGSSRSETLRAEPRMEMYLHAELRTESGGTACRLINLSRGGAGLELDSPIHPGREVVLHSGAMQSRGVVIWRDGSRCGMRFTRPIRATDLLVQMSQSRQSRSKPLSGGEMPRFPSS